MSMSFVCPHCGKVNVVGLDDLDLCFQIDDFEGQYDCIVGCSDSTCDEDVKLSISYSLAVKIEDVNKG